MFWLLVIIVRTFIPIILILLVVTMLWLLVWNLFFVKVPIVRELLEMDSLSPNSMNKVKNRSKYKRNY